MPHIMKFYDKDYLGAWDMPEKGVVVRIREVKRKEVKNSAGVKARKPVVYFEETKKGLLLNVTNARAIIGMYGPMTEEWPGKCIALYATEVSFGSKMVDAIRVRPTVPSGKAARGIESRAVDPEMREKQNAASQEVEDEAQNDPSGTETEDEDDDHAA